MSKHFDVLSEPNIHQNLFLEASAGTGKTFTIENLYIRLLIEEKEASPVLTVDEILVVTFTNAATNELKNRILDKIELSIQALETSSLPPYDYLKPFFEDKALQKKALFYLKRAQCSFGQNQIFTLHGFCSQSLREASLIPKNIASLDSWEESKSIVRDFLKFSQIEKHFLPIQIAGILRLFRSDPETLIENLAKDSSPLNTFMDYPSLDKNWDSFIKHVKTWFALPSFSYMLQEPEIFASLFKNTIEKKTGSIKTKLSELFVELCSLCQENIENNQQKARLLSTVELFTSHFTADRLRKANQGSPNHSLQDYLKIQPLLYETSQSLLHAKVNYCRLAQLAQTFLNSKWEQKQVFAPDTLLYLMQKHLKSEPFLKHLQSKYRAVCIDEFQDTDPNQWNIFSTLFLSQDSTCLLYLVGDPKQSIYGFRQADLYTFIEASSRLGKPFNKHLSVNYRSQASLVRSINTLFSQDSQNPLFTLPLLEKNLPYLSVFSSEKIPSSICPSLKLIFAGSGKEKLKKIEKELLFPYICQEIIQLENSGFCKLSQMAILVRDKQQTQLVKEALRKSNIPFHNFASPPLVTSPAFEAITELFQTLYFPENFSYLKTCLGNELFQVSFETLSDLEHSEILSEFVFVFKKLRYVLLKEGLPECLGALLQTRWPHDKLSIQEHIQFLKNSSEFQADFQQILNSLLSFAVHEKACFLNFLSFYRSFSLFLEQTQGSQPPISEPDGVKILTIHKSKGLEFDVLFPIGLYQNSQSQENTYMLNHPEHRKKQAYFSLPELEQKFYEEQNAEKIRQMYVALTRAKQRLYLPILLDQDLYKEKKSPSPISLYLKYKFPGMKLDPLSIKDGFTNLLKQEDYETINLEEPVSSCFRQTKATALTDPCKFSKKHPTTQTPTYSYTSIKHAFSSSFLSIESKESKADLHFLPRGAETGIVLHEILQHIPFHLLRSLPLELLTEKYIKPYTLLSNCEGKESIIARLIQSVLQTPLQAKSYCFTFEEIKEYALVKELDFLSYHDIEKAPYFITGIFDSLFIWEDKLFFLDWKSDYLGSSFEDYLPENVYEDARQKYSIQLSLYHEACAQIVKNCAKYQHLEFGGAFYIYLRGFLYPGQSSTAFFSPETLVCLPKSQELILETLS